MGSVGCRKRRDLKGVSGPEGEPSRHCGKKYVIQRHHARHLRYDLRLEKERFLRVGRFQKNLL